MSIESLMSFVGYSVTIFVLGYTIGHNQSSNRNDRP